MLRRSFRFFLVMIIVYVSLLSFAYSFSNENIKTNQAESLSILENEGDYPSLSKPDLKGSQLDNFTDKLMIDRTKKNVENPLKAAMSINNYSRYWHGYQIFLRPLLIFINYGSIRQLYGIVIMLLLGLNIVLMVKKRDSFFALSFFLSFYFVRFYSFFLSMQFSNVFIVMLAFNLFILTRNDADLKTNNYYLAFFIVGSITNFIDLLTVPMITLGVPLITLLYSKIKLYHYREKSIIQFFKEILLTIFSWGMGYGFTWINKWLLASVILKENTIKVAIDQAIFRTEGSKAYPLDRIDMIKSNAGLILDKLNFLALVLAVLLVIFLVIYKKKVIKGRVNPQSIVLLFVSPFPYIWYLAMSNHSQIHYWFTYRLQIITVFSLFSFLAYISSQLFPIVKLKDDNANEINQLK